MNIQETKEYLAHKHSIYNREELEKSSRIGCFYCLQIFDNPKLVTDYCDMGDTGLCPFCCIDSLIGNASGYEITKTFLHGMNEIWF